MQTSSLALSFIHQLRVNSSNSNRQGDLGRQQSNQVKHHMVSHRFTRVWVRLNQVLPARLLKVPCHTRRPVLAMYRHHPPAV